MVRMIVLVLLVTRAVIDILYYSGVAIQKAASLVNRCKCEQLGLSLFLVRFCLHTRWETSA